MVIREFFGIQPDAHGVLRAEVLDLADAGHAREHFLQVGLGIVPQVVAVHAPVFGDEPDHNQIVARRLAHLDAGLLDHGRQAGHGELQFVLHLGPGQIGIGSRREGQFDAGTARRIARAGEIQHVVEPRHLLLDDLGHAVFDRFGRSAGIDGRDGDRRRGDRRVLGNGQQIDRQPSEHHHDDGDDPSKDRPIQKEF